MLPYFSVRCHVKRLIKIVPRKQMPNPSQRKTSPNYGNPKGRFFLAGSAVLASLFLVVYTFVFFRADFASDPDSGQALSRGAAFLIHLTLPDNIPRYWMGNGIMPVNFFDRIIPFGAAGVWLILAFGFGNRSLKFLGIYGQLNRWEQIGLSTTAGLQLLSLLVLVVGLLGGLSTRWPLVAVLIAAIGFFAWLRPTPGDTDPALRMKSLNSAQRRFLGMTIVSTFAIALFYLFSSVLPPQDFDVREYHLQAPKEFAANGSIGFLEHNIYANMPLGTEMHSLAWMVLCGKDGWYEGALIGKIITSSFTILAAMIVGGIVARHLGRLESWLAMLAFLGTPGLREISSEGLIDGVLACYVVSALALISFLIDNERELPRLRSIALLMGWYLGAAISCKYTGVPMIAIPGVAILGVTVYLLNSHNRNLAVRIAMIASLATIASGGAWYAKNAILANNPVYPLLAKQLGGRGMTQERAEQWGRVHAVPRTPDGKSPDFRFSTLQNDSANFLALSLMHGLLLMPLGLLGAFSARNLFGRVTIVWAIFGLTIWWLATHRLERFWIPVLPLWACLAGWGVHFMIERWKGIPLMIFCGIGTLYSLLIMANVPFFVDLRALRYDTLRRDIDVTRLKEAELPRRVSNHQKWLNQNLGQDSRVLMVGDAGVFDMEIPILYSTCFNDSQFELASRDRKPEEQLSELKKLGVTHVLVCWQEIERYRYPGNYGFTDYVTKERLNEMVSNRVLSRVPWPIESEEADLYALVEAK